MKNTPIQIFERNNKHLTEKKRGLPDVGRNPQTKKQFSEDIMKINEGFSVYGNEIYKLDKLIDQNLPKNSLGGGSPGDFVPFPLCVEYMEKSFRQDNYSEYPLAAGEPKYRKEIIEHLKNRGFIEPKKIEEVNEDNIIFTTSTTQAFNYIFDVICKPNDVIIMTGPNYGLFSFVPERHSVTTVILPLKPEDRYKINPKALEKLIHDTNKKLQSKYKNQDYIPSVKAFLNMNPHNPLGTIMTEDDRDLLEQIGSVCRENGVFVIDDILYKDLSFPGEKQALPMGNISGMFDNTITLIGLSKAYGLAGLRAGAIIASASVIRGIRNLIFQQTDSTPVLQGAALAGAFNNSKRHDAIYKKYFSHVTETYYYRYNLLRALIEGLNSADKKYHSRIINDVKSVYGIADAVNLLQGVPNVSFVKNIDIKGGFFVLIDFTKLKGKTYNEYTITDEFELLKYLYRYGRIKFILGRSIGWGNRDEIIGRFTFALSEKEIITAMYYLNKYVKLLG